ncbi:MAG TPA: PEP/pyruvate-binding domain-containing protein [Rugosimonospora sp.]|nr:PEP/pyruvate-binding domain-containing protein [Rugosimonospora sp.]
MAELVRALADLRLADTALVGGKAASLGELVAAGTAVPPGFAVTTAAFRDALSTLDQSSVDGLDPGDVAALARVTAGIRAEIERAPLPEPLCDAILAAYASLRGAAVGPALGPAVAVRSSATAEDSADASFAGLQDTYLWVRGAAALLAHVRRCWASLYSAESVSYRLRRGIPERDLAMGVVVQRMVDARCAGVMFTRSPLSGDRSVVAVEACLGLGSALVSGEVTPDRFVVSKVTGEILTRSVAAKPVRHRMDPRGTGVVAEEVPEPERSACALTDAEVTALVAAAKRIERHYGTPQDIEWALSTADELYLLQSRPETVWSPRDATPVAVPRTHAFDHVLHLLGGQAPE